MVAIVCVYWVGVGGTDGIAAACKVSAVEAEVISVGERCVYMVGVCW